MAGKKILIVDDEPRMVELIQLRLEASKYVVVCARDGEEGLQKATAEDPDLIILDIMMPKMDGFQVAKYLKENDVTKDTPIIMLTALGTTFDTRRQENIDKIKATGAAAYLSKPFSSDTLLEEIGKALASSKKKK